MRIMFEDMTTDGTNHWNPSSGMSPPSSAALKTAMNVDEIHDLELMEDTEDETSHATPSASKVRLGIIISEKNVTKYKALLHDLCIAIHFTKSINVAEYEALLHGLCIAISLCIHRLLCHGDSDLVVQQVMKVWGAKDRNMVAYCQEVCKQEGMFDGLELHHVLQRDNKTADALAKIFLQ
jgi:ribonuclease HI